MHSTRLLVGLPLFAVSVATSFALTVSGERREPRATSAEVAVSSTPRTFSRPSSSFRRSSQSAAQRAISSIPSISSIFPIVPLIDTSFTPSSPPSSSLPRDTSSTARQASSSTGWEAFRAAMRRGGGGGGNRTEEADGSADAAPLIQPTITFGDFSLWWQYDDPVTLAPVSDSDGAFTFESSHPATLSIAGNVATMGASFRSTVTITARQAAHGAYAAGTATTTVTFHTTYCVAVPCLNGATCTPTLGGNGAENFLCTCVDDHYAGVYCEESDLNCHENGGDLFCNNGGSCVKDIDGGVCDCAGGFCGTYCEILPSQCGV